MLQGLKCIRIVDLLGKVTLKKIHWYIYHTSVCHLLGLNSNKDKTTAYDMANVLYIQPFEQVKKTFSIVVFPLLLMSVVLLHSSIMWC